MWRRCVRTQLSQWKWKPRRTSRTRAHTDGTTQFDSVFTVRAFGDVLDLPFTRWVIHFCGWKIQKKKKNTGCLIVIWRIPLICMPSRADVPVFKWISLMGAQWAACGWCGSRLVFYSKQKRQITLDACWYSSDFYTKSTLKENEFSQFLWKGKSSYKVRWSAPPAGVKFICGWFIAIELL